MRKGLLLSLTVCCVLRASQALDSQSLVDAIKSNNFALVQQHIDQAVDINKPLRPLLEDTPLIIASYEGFSAIVELLLKHGAKVNAEGILTANALDAACLHNHSKVVQILLENGADTNKQNYSGNLPEEVAQKLGFKETIKVFHRHKAEQSEKKDSATPSGNPKINAGSHDGNSSSDEECCIS